MSGPNKFSSSPLSHIFLSDEIEPVLFRLLSSWGSSSAVALFCESLLTGFGGFSTSVVVVTVPETFRNLALKSTGLFSSSMSGLDDFRSFDLKSAPFSVVLEATAADESGLKLESVFLS